MQQNNYKEINDIISDIGVNFNDSDKEILKEIYKDIETEALNISHLKPGNKKIIPIIKKYTKIAYNLRGHEGVTSASENGTSYSYVKLIEEMKQEIITNRLRRIN